MKTCDKCGYNLFMVESYVWGIAFKCGQCGYEDFDYDEHYDE